MVDFFFFLITYLKVPSNGSRMPVGITNLRTSLVLYRYHVLRSRFVLGLPQHVQHGRSSSTTQRAVGIGPLLVPGPAVKQIH